MGSGEEADRLESIGAPRGWGEGWDRSTVGAHSRNGGTQRGGGRLGTGEAGKKLIFSSIKKQG